MNRFRQAELSIRRVDLFSLLLLGLRVLLVPWLNLLRSLDLLLLSVRVEFIISEGRRVSVIIVEVIMRLTSAREHLEPVSVVER